MGFIPKKHPGKGVGRGTCVSLELIGITAGGGKRMLRKPPGAGGPWSVRGFLVGRRIHSGLGIHPKLPHLFLVGKTFPPTNFLEVALDLGVGISNIKGTKSPESRVSFHCIR